MQSSIKNAQLFVTLKPFKQSCSSFKENYPLEWRILLSLRIWSATSTILLSYGCDRYSSWKIAKISTVVLTIDVLVKASDSVTQIKIPTIWIHQKRENLGKHTRWIQTQGKTKRKRQKLNDIFTSFRNLHHKLLISSRLFFNFTTNAISEKILTLYF